MAEKNFPGPSYNRLIENDPQIVKVPMDHMEWASRASGMPSDIKNGMTIRHVGNETGK